MDKKYFEFTEIKYSESAKLWSPISSEHWISYEVRVNVNDDSQLVDAKDAATKFVSENILKRAEELNGTIITTEKKYKEEKISEQQQKANLISEIYNSTTVEELKAYELLANKDELAKQAYSQQLKKLSK